MSQETRKKKQPCYWSWRTRCCGKHRLFQKGGKKTCGFTSAGRKIVKGGEKKLVTYNRGRKVDFYQPKGKEVMRKGW